MQLAFLARDLDHHDGVLCGERDQQDEADLGIDIVRKTKRGRAPAVPSSASGPLIGVIQLSYWPESTG